MTLDNISDAPVDRVGAFLFAVDSLREIQSAQAGLAAMEMALYAAVFAQAEAITAEMAHPIIDREQAIRTASAEIGAALRVSDRTVQRRMSHAFDVTAGFPQTFEALREGRITASHVSTIVKASEGLPTGEARETYEGIAIERAEQLSPGRLGAILPGIAAQIHECSLAERHQRARKRRRIEVRDTEDGMAELLAVLPAVLAHGMYDRLTSMAKAVEGAEEGDERCRDEIRADALSDLVLGGGPVAVGDGLEAIQAQVQVTVPVLTAARVSEHGAELHGSGPMDAETARRLAGAASGWDRVMTHPISGAILAVDRYRPSQDIRRALRVRDEHCRFPGCRQPAHRCDADHSLAAVDGGDTCIDNMALLCRRHHGMKHDCAWAIAHLGNGVLRWTSPSGRDYIDTPTSTLRFFPAGPDPDDPDGPGDPDGSDDPDDPGGLDGKNAPGGLSGLSGPGGPGGPGGSADLDGAVDGVSLDNAGGRRGSDESDESDGDESDESDESVPSWELLE